MRLVDGRDHFICDYCSSRAFPDASEVVVSQQVSQHACPECQQPLAHGTLAAQPVWTCVRCRGVLATNEDFALIVKRVRARFDGPRETRRPVCESELSRELHCPACKRRMETHPYYGPGGVVIDSCAACHLVWLDAGELRAIERAEGAVWR